MSDQFEELEKTVNEVKLDVGLLKKDVILVNDIGRKLDLTIDKIQELNMTVNKMLARH